MREDEVGAPFEVLGHDVACRDGELLTVRLHTGHVGILGDGTAYTVGAQRADQVVVVTGVPVEREVDAVVEETEVNTYVELVLLFVGQVFVGEAVDDQTRLLVGGVAAPDVVAADDGAGVGHGRLVTGERVAGLQCGVGECGAELVSEPGLLVDVPCTRHVPCGQPACAGRFTEAVATLVAHSSVQGVTTLP